MIGLTEAETRAALRAFVGVGNVEPWIAAQEWEATPDGWTVPFEGWVFRLELIAGGIRVTASMSRRPPAVWTVPNREAGRG